MASPVAPWAPSPSTVAMMQPATAADYATYAA
jgi:hypothetical protein